MGTQVLGLILVAFCGFTLLAEARNWSWWTDNIYSNRIREEWGEDGYMGYTWLICGLGIIFGTCVMLGIDPYEQLLGLP